MIKSDPIPPLAGMKGGGGNFQQMKVRSQTIKNVKEKRPLRAILDEQEHAKASIRVKVMHPFHLVKNLFRQRKKQAVELAFPCSVCSVKTG